MGGGGCERFSATSPPNVVIIRQVLPAFSLSASVNTYCASFQQVGTCFLFKTLLAFQIVSKMLVSFVKRTESVRAVLTWNNNKEWLHSEVPYKMDIIFFIFLSNPIHCLSLRWLNPWKWKSFHIMGGKNIVELYCNEWVISGVNYIILRDWKEKEKTLLLL